MIRPGRIDYQVNFTYSTKYQIKNMINRLLPEYSDYINDFINKVKSKKLTTAILQKYFFDCKKNKINIIDNIEYIDKLIQYQSQTCDLYL